MMENILKVIFIYLFEHPVQISIARDAKMWSRFFFFFLYCPTSFEMTFTSMITAIETVGLVIACLSYKD